MLTTFRKMLKDDGMHETAERIKRDVDRRLAPREQHELLIIHGAIEGCCLKVDAAGNVAEVLRPGWEDDCDLTENLERLNHH